MRRMLTPKKERLRIIEKAAELILEDIIKIPYVTDTFPSPNKFLDDMDKLVPKSLHVFLEKVLEKHKNPLVEQKLEKRRTFLAHSMITSVKPRSFYSPLLLSIGSWIYKKIGSHTLIQQLSLLGICSSYHYIRILESSSINSNNITISKEALKLIQFGYDNCDINVNTIDGLHTFHNMIGVMYVTPAQAMKSSSEPIPVCKKLSRAALMKKRHL